MIQEANFKIIYLYAIQLALGDAKGADLKRIKKLSLNFINNKLDTLSEELTKYLKERELLITAKNFIEKNLNNDTKVFCYFDSCYPENWKKDINILFSNKVYPLVVFYKGNLELLERSKKIGCIGPRDCSKESQVMAESVCKDLDAPIVSGGATGIDTIAQNSAKESIVILPNSFFDHNKIKTNELNSTLYLSTQKDGLNHFEYRKTPLLRNWLIASLSTAMLVFSLKKIRSGTTACCNYALKLETKIAIYQNEKYVDTYFASKYKTGLVKLFKNKPEVKNLLENFHAGKRKLTDFFNRQEVKSVPDSGIQPEEEFSPAKKRPRNRLRT